RVVSLDLGLTFGWPVEKSYISLAAGSQFLRSFTMALLQVSELESGPSAGYASVNTTLRQLYQERMKRDYDRHWNSPDEILLGDPARPLRLCSLPGQHLGAQVWHSGHLLANALAGRSGSQPLLEVLRGARVLELGAGLGIAGLAAAAFAGAAAVVLTDLPEMQPLLRRNIELNDLTGCCRAETLAWGSTLPESWGAFDVVLAADVVYPTKDPTCLIALRDTILALCPLGSSTTLLLAYKFRTEWDQDFLKKEILPHFIVVEEELVEPTSNGVGKRCQLFTCRRQGSPSGSDADSRMAPAST
ncbi:unnamed protein product, partial [Polarella glacialis]